MAYNNGFDTNQQKRIAFLSIHGHFMSAVKQEKELDGKKHQELCEYIFAVVNNLFAKWPTEADTKVVPTIKKTGEAPY